MADYNTLDSPHTRDNSRPASTRSIHSRESPQESSRTSEVTPLLARRDSEDDSDHDEEARPRSAASSLLHSLQPKVGIFKRRWPSFLALLLLCIFTVAIMLLGFFVPEVMEQYAMQAKQFELTSISLPEFTSSGAKARIQGVFYMDPSRVSNKHTRNLGIFGTWIAKEVRSSESTVKVSLPEYGGVVLGTATVPPIKVKIQANQKTSIDFLADLEPGDVKGIRKVADDWISGRLGQLRVVGEASVNIKSGWLGLGTQNLAETLVFAGDQIPNIPDFNITKLMFHEVELPDGTTGMEADVSILVKNEYPIDLAVPPLSFGVMVDNCQPSQPHIMVADASTNKMQIRPQMDLNVSVSGMVKKLPDELTNACPSTGKSPLDAFLGDYIHGEDTTIYVRGSDHPSEDTPQWLSELMSSITVPVPFAGHTFGSLIRNFSLADVHFSLPDPFAEPDTPESNPQISATIKAFINLPGEMNFPVDVNRVRANALVYYHGRQLGRLDLHKWQEANSTRIPPYGDLGPALLVESAVKDAPLEITDQGVFSEIVQKMLFGGKPIKLTIKADVDVEMETALGILTIRQIPAEGVVPIKTLANGDDGLTHSFKPQVGNLEIVDTSEHGLIIQAEVNFTNPTNYSATVPFVDIQIEKNGTVLAHAQVLNATIMPGKNKNIAAKIIWEPAASGKNGTAVGAEFLSQYISGYNTTLTVRTHKGTIPAQPKLGEALSNFSITIPTPRLLTPKVPDDGDNPTKPGDPADPEDPEDGKPHFIKSATMHLLSSTAVFSLISPFRKTTLYITSINASAYYKDDDVGKIDYDLPFAVMPGESESPRLPVDWSLGSVGYEAVRKALGGTLKLSAVADVGVRIGRYEVGVWFRGGGIGAGVRL